LEVIKRILNLGSAGTKIVLLLIVNFLGFGFLLSFGAAVGGSSSRLSFLLFFSLGGGVYCMAFST